MQHKVRECQDTTHSEDVPVNPPRLPPGTQSLCPETSRSHTRSARGKRRLNRSNRSSGESLRFVAFAVLLADAALAGFAKDAGVAVLLEDVAAGALEGRVGLAAEALTRLEADEE